MKKIISVFICAIMVLSLLPFTASAADEIDFTLRIKSETDNEVVLTLDYDGGTGFCALDIDISYDRVRLERKNCEKGDGYVAFEKYLSENDALSMCSINPGGNPMKVSMANTIGFKKIDGKKSVITLRFAKVPGTKFAKEDVTFDFTNCQTEAFTNIKVNLDYDLKQPVSVVDKTDSTDKTEGSTEYPQQPSQDNVEGEDSEIGDTPEADNGQDVIGQDVETPKNEEDGVGDTATTGEKSDKTKTIVIIVAVSVVVLGAGAVVIVKVKGKNKKD